MNPFLLPCVNIPGAGTIGVRVRFLMLIIPDVLYVRSIVLLCGMGMLASW